MQIYQVDAFTDHLFSGNPAGVCILPSGKIGDDTLLQNIAAEVNASETAFLYGEKGEYRLRWFTPETEVQLCGHATLSAAHILWENGIEEKTTKITFNTLSGQLFTRYVHGRVELDFPAYEVKEIPAKKEINKALGIEPVFTGNLEHTYLFEINSLEVLKKLKPDFMELRKVGKNTFIVTCKSANVDYDFYSRFFAPFVGINEDPVTGSAHCYLTPYWSNKLGKNLLKAYQSSRRGGTLECELPGNGRVLIRGKAVTVFKIEMNEL